ncbi:transcriptional regulator, CdaR [Alkaliphilus metalliredigens QYMF]|uniref:Transcriptional regulator, CdaR n=1 Tax=Alkaliphilus metalliredigens (strain QYMF) TaxID=293826 RepID=A6TWU1_ALKMQ|nr:PucR family transcriptional regulator [Alkaliphilus metalliredigens]ABR50659.1 transcriptional regulator, CdaR [Alkaliphilus metalliredigens QYMF]
MHRQNGITIDEVLKMECMEKSKLIAGFKGTGNAVTKVNVMADPDILNWVDEGELLLTTAYSFQKDDKEAQKSLIQACSEKGLAGIGIKIYPYLECLSEEVLAIADKLNLPIIDLYYATPFSDIMTPVFREIFNRQTSLLQRLEKIHERLMKVVLAGGEVKEIAQVVYENLRNPIAIRIGAPHQWLYHLEDIEDVMKQALKRDAQGFYDPNLSQWKEKKLDERVELIQEKYLRRMVMPIVVKNSVYGHIFAWSVFTPLGGFDLSVLETASTTMALEILKQLSVRDVENRYRGEFLDDLLSLDATRKQKAMERAHIFKLDAQSSYVMIIIQFQHQSREVVGFLEEKLNSISSEIQSFLSELSFNVFLVNKTDSIHLLVDLNGTNQAEQVLKNFTLNLNELLNKKMKTQDFGIGVGRMYKGLCQSYKSYHDAMKAIETGAILEEGQMTYFDDLGIYKILCQDVLKEELEQFYQVTLSSLDQYDSKKKTELVKTLEMYFQYNGNLKRISEALFTHYNTTLYRIQRIKQITELDLEDQRDRLNLEVALKIKKILKK